MVTEKSAIIRNEFKVEIMKNKNIHDKNKIIFNYSINKIQLLISSN